MTDVIKQKDQIKMLEACLTFTETGNFPGVFSYPNCGWDLVKQGLATQDKKITMAGRALLWHLGKGEDPTDSASCETFSIKLKVNKNKDVIRYNSDASPRKCGECKVGNFEEDLGMLICDNCGQRYESL